MAPRPPGSPGLLTATPLRAGVARDCSVVAWCDLCWGISYQDYAKYASTRLFMRDVWGEGMAHWVGGGNDELERTSKYEVAKVV